MSVVRDVTMGTAFDNKGNKIGSVRLLLIGIINPHASGHVSSLAERAERLIETETETIETEKELVEV